MTLLFLAFLAVRGRRASYRAGRFLTVNEKSFLGALDEAAGREFRVFAQVRLADLVEIDGRPSEAKRRAAMNKVFGKSIDFVICDAVILEPVAAIGLDDRTHALAHRRERDAFVDKVFAEIGVPLLRVRARRAYSTTEVEALLRSIGVTKIGKCAFASRERR
ncbi:DUF2726 domain-containing protein [Methylocystis sp. IM4]|uniref:DUF2726 domain-containing protein n=1 Tax=Methylocystis sp. IM4 TaxID=3136560 RepID=UPI003119108B